VWSETGHARTGEAMEDERTRNSRLQAAGLLLAVVGPQVTGFSPGAWALPLQPVMVLGAGAAGVAMIWAGRASSGFSTQVVGALLAVLGALKLTLVELCRVWTGEPIGSILGIAILATGIWLFVRPVQLGRGQLIGIPLLALAVEVFWYRMFIASRNVGMIESVLPGLAALGLIGLGARLVLGKDSGLQRFTSELTLGQAVGLPAALVGAVVVWYRTNHMTHQGVLESRNLPTLLAVLVTAVCIRLCWQKTGFLSQRPFSS